MKRKRDGRRLCPASPKTAEVVQIYLIIFFLQPFQLASRNGEVKKRSRDPFHREKRRCVCCRRRISNRSLGGYSGRSALSGSLFCYRCADLPPQLLLPLGDL